MAGEQVNLSEPGLRALCEAGRIDEAASAALRLYGAEIFGFLLALSRGDEDSAGDVFSLFSEQLWRGLPAFNWHSSMRTWAYAVARNASRAHRRAAQRQARRSVALSDCPAVAEMAAAIRSETLSFLRTERKNALAELRDELPEDDKTLLILRIDRELSWPDLARVFLGEEGATPEALGREAARLRKRFQIIKQRIAQLGHKRGLLPGAVGR